MAITLVVAGHLLAGNEKALSVFITACHMPAFFFVSGYFFNRSSSRYTVRGFLRKKAAALLVPYICWSLVSLVMNGSAFLLHRDLAGFGNEAAEIFVYARSVWFLAVLFFAEIFYFLVVKAAERLQCSPCLAGILAWSASMWLYARRDGGWDVVQLYKFEWLFPYFLAGDMCGRAAKPAWEWQRKTPAAAACACIYVLLLAVFYRENAYEEFYGGFRLVFGHAGYYLAYYVLGCIGTALLFLTAGILKSRSGMASGTFYGKLYRIISTAGYYSKDIYVLHMFPVKMLRLLFNPAVDTVLYNYVIVPLAGFAVAAGVAFFSEHILHRFWIYRFSTGRR